ncbi:hypothetical protein [Knoellia aerolata]|uniref:Uncharacterized protein n=1 Tax=Knoellia aerolata DSM 18566 TaxID=1385519 RepID=A0A0A0JZW1_9MICO|nr:hypothetical protein [Knoellia aerolata]KGN41046.1 hypothetical protein N801_09710 [Knoellia aerolata DSM 18566]
MTHFQLRQPAKAVRYTFRLNESEVIELIAATGRRLSYSNAQGVEELRIWGDLELRIPDGSWVVVMARDVSVLSDEYFSLTFVPSKS